MSSGLSLGPRSVERPADAGFTLVGVLDGRYPARIDGAGLVQLAGCDWSLDWWIGGDDRWYLPAREATIRQRRLGFGPVLETAMRIPSGDAKQRVYAASVSGRQVIIVEVENDSPVPVAVGLAVRPYDLDGESSPTTISLDEDILTVTSRSGGEGDSKQDAATVEAAIRLPREPNEYGASSKDVLDVVSAGLPLAVAVQADGGANTGVVLYPLPHRTTLRFVLDPSVLDPGSAAESNVLPAGSIPGPNDVAKGWGAILDRSGRFSFPDPGLTQQVGVARTRLLNSAPTLARRIAELAPGSGRVLEGLALSSAASEVQGSLAVIAGSFFPRLSGEAADAAAVVVGVGRAARIVDDSALVEELLEPLTQLTLLVEKSRNPVAAAQAFRGLARLLMVVGQPLPAQDLLVRAEAMTGASGRASRSTNGSGGTKGGSHLLAELTELAEQASSAGSWGEDQDGPAASFWLGARSMLIDDQPALLRLLPDFPRAWMGGQVEVHGATTSHGLLSFGIRWHGYRPALLWELEPAETAAPVTITCPGLDPDWSTNEQRGETLLAGSAQQLPEVPQAGQSFQ